MASLRSSISLHFLVIFSKACSILDTISSSPLPDIDYSYILWSHPLQLYSLLCLCRSSFLWLQGQPVIPTTQPSQPGLLSFQSPKALPWAGCFSSTGTFFLVLTLHMLRHFCPGSSRRSCRHKHVFQAIQICVFLLWHDRKEIGNKQKNHWAPQCYGFPWGRWWEESRGQHLARRSCSGCVC